VLDSSGKDPRTLESVYSSRKSSFGAVKTLTFTTSSPPRFTPPQGEERRTTELNQPKGEDKLSVLKAYRKAKGLCFKCGEK